MALIYRLSLLVVVRVWAHAAAGSAASSADLKRAGREKCIPGRECFASSLDTSESASLVQLQRRDIQAARRLESASAFSGRAQSVATEDVLKCFSHDCDGDLSGLGAARCMMCIAPLTGKDVSLSDAIREVKRWNQNVLAGENPYNIDIPDAHFKAKGKNSGSPLGYIHLCKGDIAHCGRVYDNDCYGPKSVCLTRWQDVMDWGPQLVEGQWNGSIWRGHELGTGFLVPYMWSGRGIYPYTALGVTPKQHYSISPALVKAFGPGRKNSAEYRETEAMIREEVRRFLSERKEKGLTVGVPGDVMAFVHGILFRHVFKRECSEAQRQLFYVLQLLALGTALQSAEANPLAKVPTLMPTLRAQLALILDAYKPMVQEMYGDLIAGEDCSPSESCLAQLSSAILDGFMLAGGISVTFAINTGIALLFSTAEPSGTPFSGSEQVDVPPDSWKHWGNPFRERAYEPGQELQFYWEVLRYFAPVGSITSWTTPVTCNDGTTQTMRPDGGSVPCPRGAVDDALGIPQFNQYTGGAGHVYPVLPVAQRDPAKFGLDANEFKIRNLDVYKWSVGFGESAVNDKVANGRMNRVCPGKSLALMIGSIFFEEFKKEDWEPPRNAASITFTQGSKPNSQGGMPFSPAFTLSSKKMVSECKELCPPITSLSEEARECLADTRHCLCEKCEAMSFPERIGDFKCLMCIR